jgi:hypothetical protein
MAEKNAPSTAPEPEEASELAEPIPAGGRGRNPKPGGRRGGGGPNIRITADPEEVDEGQVVQLVADVAEGAEKLDVTSAIWRAIKDPYEYTIEVGEGSPLEAVWDTTGVEPGHYGIRVELYGDDPTKPIAHGRLDGVEVGRRAPEQVNVAQVSMRRAFKAKTDDEALWTIIRMSTDALGFDSYNRFMDRVLCGDGFAQLRDDRIRSRWERTSARLRLPFPDVDAYRQLKVATEVFMMMNCGVRFDREGLFALGPDEFSAERRRFADEGLLPGDIEALWRRYLDPVDTNVDGSIDTLPYLSIIRRKLREVPIASPTPAFLKEQEAAVACYEILTNKLTRPCFLELIWSYWHEEGLLVQTMNSITWRFQNRRGPGDRDPLAAIEIDPLRPLNNFLWGYIQDEEHRLSVPRRAYEYDHHYGVSIVGKAVPPVQGADSRSRFLAAFHHLLHVCSIFFKEDDDTTVVADGFPILNALKEVHLLLTQGAHNQYGDLPWTARQEMLMQEWLLARPEFREFLPRRVMVDYPEPWMDSVETMKTLQSWNSASVMHFRDLGVFGEQVLLGVRFGAWPSVIESEAAANWARYWRPEIQGYIHAYRAVTGVDLTERVDATMPSTLLRQQMGRYAAAPASQPPGRTAGALRRPTPVVQTPVPSEQQEWSEIVP